MLRESSFQRPPSLPDVGFITIVTADVKISIWAFTYVKKINATCVKNTRMPQKTKKGDLQNKYDLHLRNKDHIRQKKENDKMEARNREQTFRAAVLDLEQVLPCPAGEASFLFYHCKFAMFNLIIFVLAFNKGHNFMWHEGIGSCGANEVASCV